MTEKNHAQSLRLQSLYNALGSSYDWFTRFEVRARQTAWRQLDPQPGEHLLHVGCGPGREQTALHAAVQPQGAVVGIDLSIAMVRSAARRSQSPVCQADGANLPFAAESFDGLLCAYTLDLVQGELIPGWIAGFQRVLRTGGRLVLLSLTEGVDPFSRSLVSLWKGLYRLSPLACGGCRPLQLVQQVGAEGFQDIQRSVTIDWGVPSEVILAKKALGGA